MPVVQAYLCPRTNALFLQKADYVEHLKALARESLKEKRAERKVIRLKTAFAEMRKTVRSFEELGDWLKSNMKLLYEYSTTIPFMPKPVKPRKATPRLKQIYFANLAFQDKCLDTSGHPEHGVRYLNGSRFLTRYPGVKGQFSFTTTGDFSLHHVVDAAIYLFSDAGGGGHKGQYAFSFTMFAEDWPFIGVYFLHAARESELTEDLQRVIQYCFPGITIESYTRFKDAGLLPEDLPGFSDFMFSYVSALSNPHSKYVQIPSDLALDIA